MMATAMQGIALGALIQGSQRRPALCRAGLRMDDALSILTGFASSRHLLLAAAGSFMKTEGARWMGL